MFEKSLIRKQPFKKNAVLTNSQETIFTMKTILTSHLVLCIMIIPYLIQAQTITISGNVTSSDGEALENVSIFESESKIGTITNKKGYFQLILSGGELNLKITESGYIAFSEKMMLTKDSTFFVQLEPLVDNKSKSKKSDSLHAEVKPVKKYLGIRRFK